MKKLLTALAVSAYIVPAALLSTLLLLYLSYDAAAGASAFADSTWLILAAIPILFILLSCALSLACMIRAIRAAKETQTLSFRDILRFKLRMIPLYIFDFVCFIIFGMTIMGPWGMIFVPLACGHIWWMMAGLSAHTIAALFVLRKQDRMSKRQFVLHCLLQLIFAWDLLDSIYLAKKPTINTTKE